MAFISGGLLTASCFMFVWFLAKASQETKDGNNFGCYVALSSLGLSLTILNVASMIVSELQ